MKFTSLSDVLHALEEVVYFVFSNHSVDIYLSEEKLKYLGTLAKEPAPQEPDKTVSEEFFEIWEQTLIVNLHEVLFDRVVIA